MVSVEKGGILVTSFLWLWILSHGNVLLAFLRSFYLNYLHLCPESLPDVHLIRAHAASTWPAALCALPASCRQEKYDHATLNKTRKRSTACCCSSISPQAFVKATFFVIFIQDVYVLSNPIIIHNNTSLLHISAAGIATNV